MRRPALECTSNVAAPGARLDSPSAPTRPDERPDQHPRRHCEADEPPATRRRSPLPVSTLRIPATAVTFNITARARQQDAGNRAQALHLHVPGRHGERRQRGRAIRQRIAEGAAGPARIVSAAARNTALPERHADALEDTSGHGVQAQVNGVQCIREQRGALAKPAKLTRNGLPIGSHAAFLARPLSYCGRCLPVFSSPRSSLALTSSLLFMRMSLPCTCK